jgi:phosphate starvation-inducible membrane PsiE
MNDTPLAYLISLAIIGIGVGWIVTGANSAISIIWITIGILTIAVGLISILTELRNTPRSDL